MGNRPNLVQDDPELAIAEVGRFKAAGGQTVVEVSSHGLERHVRGLKRVAEQTGLHILAGTGYYIAASHPPELGRKSVEYLTEAMVRDAEQGIDGTEIRAGVLGEIGTSEPLDSNEVKVLRAAARTQRRTGLTMVVDPAPQHRDARVIGRWLDLLEDGGATPGKVVLSHLEERLRDSPDDFSTLAGGGYMLALDTWGNEIYYDTRGFQMPSDGERVRLLARPVSEGLTDHLVLGQDVCFRIQLTTYGGAGYAHLLTNLPPRFRQARIPEAAVEQMLVDNRRRVLTVAP